MNEEQGKKDMRQKYMQIMKVKSSYKTVIKQKIPKINVHRKREESCKEKIQDCSPFKALKKLFNFLIENNPSFLSHFAFHSLCLHVHRNI